MEISSNMYEESITSYIQYGLNSGAYIYISINNYVLGERFVKLIYDQTEKLKSL